ncbi:MAG: hypothetical protein M1832_005701 [Thelocarpon impressellum]|nr:MAG: hypothetical protein M1832_005701 [Thelocarpon impressellum]
MLQRPKTRKLPGPQDWTLRLKNGRTTVLIDIQQTTSYEDLKKELLLALNSIDPSGTLNGAPIPTDHEDVLLARQVDLHDITRGWQALELPEEGSAMEHMQGMGMKDRACLAFHFEGQGETGDVDLSIYEEE